MRPEDKNARQVQQAFANGATLAELEQHLAYLRSLGAPDDAYPKVGVNEDYEVTVMICVVERPTARPRLRLKGSSGALASGPLGRALAACELVRAVDEACAEQAHAPVSAAPLPRLAQQAAAAARWSTGNCRWRDVWRNCAQHPRAGHRPVCQAAYDELEHARRVWCG